uniref:Putative nucleosome-binding factor spn pob3 subunit n=1 Tax=Amblyomma aureolatum TaxID=187763 RepID=A0A1E1X9L7_9ACAR
MGKGDKPRGRMSAYAFFVQTCREEHKKKHPNENVVFAEFSKKCAERWKTMSDGEKKRFHQMADKDKKRFDSEMADYKPPKGDKSKKRKRAKDPNAPKRPLSAFFWFCNDERPNVRQENPDSSVGEVAKELGRRWNEVGDDVKAKYEGLAAKDKARYEKELKAYKGKKTKGGSPPKDKAKKKDEDDDDEEEEEEDEAEDAEEDDDEED